MTRAPVPPEKIEDYANRVRQYQQRRDAMYRRGGAAAVHAEADNIRQAIAGRIKEDGLLLTQHLIEHWHDLLAIFERPDAREECPT